jgi:Rrf2 family protein
MRKTNSSMQLTRAADYGVRVMIYLASAGAEARLSLVDLAHATNAPESFLSKVLQSLSRSGLISSRRGQSGGFKMSTRGRAASMLDVIEAVDGRISLNLCMVPGKSCSRKATCPAHPVWADAQRAMLQVLDSATIAALAAASGKTGHSSEALQACTVCPSILPPL